MSNPDYLLGSYYQNNYTEAQNAQFTQVFDAITKQMVHCLQQGLSSDSEQMQAAVHQHFEFCLQFWKPNRESYSALAMSYILPTPYRDTYEAYQQGLGQYIYDAVVFYANKNLS